MYSIDVVKILLKYIRTYVFCPIIFLFVLSHVLIFFFRCVFNRPSTAALINNNK